MDKIRWRIVVKDNQEIVEEIHKIIVHKFRLSDVEDPDLYAAQPLWEWQQSEQGQFVMKHAVDQPEWHRHLDVSVYGYQYTVVAELEKKKLSEFYLKWGKPK